MADVREYGADELVALLPLPADDANKYTRGRLVVVAGSARYPGAACLAACAGQRAGAGYTEVDVYKRQAPKPSPFWRRAAGRRFPCANGCG